MGFELAGINLQDIDLKTLLTSFLAIALGSVYVIIKLLSHTPRPPFPEELNYQTADAKGSILKKPLPNVTAQAEDDILISVVVPSYNETSRIMAMLTEAVKYLKKSMPKRWEIIIVDDGSVDGTTDYCLELSHKTFGLDAGQIRVIKFEKNRGKGGAVRQGLLHVRGQYALFADADGASNFSDVENLLKSIQHLEGACKSSNKAAIAIGSRAHMVNTDAVVKRSFVRNLLMYGLHTLVFVFGIRSIKDTQCGFKLFNRQAILEIFPFLHTEGWIFDVEILMLAIRKSIPIAEVSISWHEVDGSKMDLARDSINMAIDLVVIRMAYILGIYKDRLESAPWH